MSWMRTQTRRRNNGECEVSILTPSEKAYLDVFLHEATTSPFTGPATRLLHAIGAEYGDLSYIAWGYEQDVPRTGFAIGHAANVSPPLPWTNKESVLQRNKEIQHLWEQQRKVLRTEAPPAVDRAAG
jgi:hypothetical protein